jgi:hypothetical protein
MNADASPLPVTVRTLDVAANPTGNRLDLYDTVMWFDDVVHFANTGIITVAVLLQTFERTATRGAVLERALAFGLSAAVTWEIAEYMAFVSDSSERLSAYPDTWLTWCLEQPAPSPPA